jgi:hypothetical protein
MQIKMAEKSTAVAERAIEHSMGPDGFLDASASSYCKVNIVSVMGYEDYGWH